MKEKQGNDKNSLINYPVKKPNIISCILIFLQVLGIIHSLLLFCRKDFDEKNKFSGQIDNFLNHNLRVIKTKRIETLLFENKSTNLTVYEGSGE